MTHHTGSWVARDSGGNGTTAQGSRLAQAGLLAKNADGTVRTGVLADGLGPVVTGAAGMSYSIRAHVAVTKMSDANGPTLVPNDSAVSVSTDPAPGSNSRIDVIWVRQRHVTGDGGSESSVAPEFGVAKGASNASPSAPPLPTGAVELARATVTAGTTATSGLTFTQGRWTVANGAPVPVHNLVERDAMTGYAGLRVMRLDNMGLIEKHNGTGWRPEGQAVDSSGGSPYWGVAFDPAIHQYKTYSRTVVATPIFSGDITLLAPLGSVFAGVSSVVASPADPANSATRQVVINIGADGTTLGARLYGAGGAALTSADGNERVNFIAHGWA